MSIIIFRVVVKWFNITSFQVIYWWWWGCLWWNSYTMARYLLTMENSIAHEVSKDVYIIHKSLSLDIKLENPLISPQVLDSWNTLLDAANIRNHVPILDLADFMTGKNIPRVYDRKFRSVFIMKEARMSSSESRICTQDCIFCGKIKCYKGTSTRERANKAVDLRADEAYEELLGFIRNKIIPNKEIVEMTTLERILIW